VAAVDPGDEPPQAAEKNRARNTAPVANFTTATLVKRRRTPVVRPVLWSERAAYLQF